MEHTMLFTFYKIHISNEHAYWWSSVIHVSLHEIAVSHTSVATALWCPLVPAGARWCPLVPAGARWCPLVPAGARWCPLVPAGARWCPMPFSHCRSIMMRYRSSARHRHGLHSTAAVLSHAPAHSHSHIKY